MAATAVRGLALRILSEQGLTDTDRQNAATRFAASQCRAMPDPHGWGLQAIAALFVVEWAVRSLPGSRQRALGKTLASWRRSPLRACRLFVELVETLALYGYLADD